MDPHERSADPRPPAGQPGGDDARAAGETIRQRLRTTEQRLHTLIESAIDYAIFSMDLQGRVNYWNKGAERVCGFREDEILGQPGDFIFTPEDRANHVPDQEFSTALREGRALDERWHMRKNGERFWASGVMTALREPDGTVVGFAKIMRDLTERKLAEDRLKRAREELEARVAERTAELAAMNETLRTEMAQRVASEDSRRELTRLLATAQEAERLRVSRELHDEIGQHLAAVMLGLNSLEQQVRDTPAATILKTLQDLTERIGSEVHALAVQLRPTALDDLGLTRALTTYADVWSKQTGIKIELHLAAVDNPRLRPDLEVAIYRIVQEALTNVVRHAQAQHVSLIVNRQGSEVVVAVEDDGKGFDPDLRKASPRQGIGLLGMRERAAQLHGRLTIESAPGEGTTVLVRIPVS